MTRYGNRPLLPVPLPLAVSLVVTAAVAGFVCSPPAAPLHSWAQIFSLATAYVLLAASVHALAIWSVCRVREDTETAAGPLILSLIWAAWLVVVWLPLLALLTAEHSPWVAAILPITAVFAVLLLRWRASHVAAAEPPSIHPAPRQLFAAEQSPPQWKILLPAAGAALALQGGVAILAAGHAWAAGCLLGLATLYPLHRWSSHAGPQPSSDRTVHWTATANSAVVWLLIVLSLLPFMARFAAGVLSAALHIEVHGRPLGAPAKVARGARGWEGLILTTPPKPHELVLPPELIARAVLGKPEVTAFDGTYWYFKGADRNPGPYAHVMPGDPVKLPVRSTDSLPITMEAHQRLSRPIIATCCRSMRLDVVNADTVSGPLTIEVLLHDTHAKTGAISLGREVLRSSTLAPMPLQRDPVDDSLTFQLPRSVRVRPFNEITIRIRPGSSFSLAGHQVSVRDFVLQR